MSTETATVVIRGQTDGVSAKLKEVADGTDKVKKSAEAAGAAQEKWGQKLDAIDKRMKGFADGISKVTGLLGAGGLVGMAVGAGAALGALGERAQQVSLANQALKISIDGARQATMGMVSNYDLTIAANKAITLGVVKTDKEFAQLAKTAAKLGAAMGQDATKSVDDLTTALGRGSAEILDNLGVQLKVSDAHDRYAQILGKVTSELTETEKKQAFMVVGLEKATEAADRAGVSLDTHAAKLQAASAEWSNFKDSMAVAATEAGGFVAGAFTTLGEAIGQTAYNMTSAQESMFSFAQSIQFARMDVEKQTAALFAQADAAADAAIAAEKLGQVYQMTDRDKRFEERIKKEQEAFAEEQAYRELFYGPEEAPKQKKTGKRKAPTEDVLNQDRFMDASIGGIESTNEIQTSIALEANNEAMARELQLRQDRIAIIQHEQEIAALQVEGGLLSADAEEVVAQRKYLAEQDLLEFQIQAATTRAEIIDLETAKRNKALQEQQRQMVKSQQVETKALAQKQATYQQYGAAVGNAIGAVTMAAIEGANGQDHAAARVIAAVGKQIRNQLIMTAIQESVLAIASAASFNYIGAAQHGIAAGVATGGAILVGSIAGVAGAMVPPSPPASSGGGGDRDMSGPSGGSSSSSKSKSRDGSDDDGVPTSYYDGGLYSKRPDRMPQAANGNGGGGDTYVIQAFGGTTDQVFQAIDRGIAKTKKSIGPRVK